MKSGLSTRVQRCSTLLSLPTRFQRRIRHHRDMHPCPPKTGPHPHRRVRSCVCVLGLLVLYTRAPQAANTRSATERVPTPAPPFVPLGATPTSVAAAPGLASAAGVGRDAAGE